MRNKKGRSAAEWFYGTSFAGRTPPTATVEKPARDLRPHGDETYGSDPLPELTPPPRKAVICCDGFCDCTWFEEEPTVAERRSEDFESNER